MHKNLHTRLRKKNQWDKWLNGLNSVKFIGCLGEKGQKQPHSQQCPVSEPFLLKHEWNSVAAAHSETWAAAGVCPLPPRTQHVSSATCGDTGRNLSTSSDLYRALTSCYCTHLWHDMAWHGMAWHSLPVFIFMHACIRKCVCVCVHAHACAWKVQLWMWRTARCHSSFSLRWRR